MMTSERVSPKLPFWPFFFVGVLLLALAAVLLVLANKPLRLWEAYAPLICVGGAAWSFIFPFLRRTADTQALAQAELLAASVGQINKTEQLAAQIAAATAQWQSVQSCALKIADSSKETCGAMQTEVTKFADVMQKANDTEKAHLRLEVDKLRRSEIEWIQVLTRILDHVFALSQAAAQSGQPNLIEQIGQFQNVCQDIARRVGLVPLIAAPGEALDTRLHQLVEPDQVAKEKAMIKGTLACGYSYQGKLIRRAIVALQEETSPLPPAMA